MPDLTLSTLQMIRSKVRRLTRSPSPSQIGDAEIDEYVNTFVLYDFPETLKLFSLRKVFTFYTQPYIDSYSTTTAVPTDPLYNFKNRFVSIHKQITIAGYPTLMSESRDQFYGIYPLTNSISSIGVGDGVTTIYTGTLVKIPVIRGAVLFSSVDTTNNGLSLVDVPVPGSSVGNLNVPDTGVSVGTINYITGAYTFTFPAAPLTGKSIDSQTIPYVASRPQALLYFDDTFIVRPVPDQPYRVELEAYARPTELLNGADMPDICEWWQYIAYGSAKKIFEDRLDMESIQSIMPEFKNQERLVLRRTLLNNSNERTASVYTEQVDLSSGISGWGGNNV